MRAPIPSATIFKSIFYGSTVPLNQALLIVEVSGAHLFRNTTFDTTPLDEWSARRRDLYQTRHITHKRKTPMTPAGFELLTPTSERPQLYDLDRVAYGIVLCILQSRWLDGQWPIKHEKKAILCLNHGNQCRTESLRPTGRQNQDFLYNMVDRTKLLVSQLVLVRKGSFSSGLWWSVRGSVKRGAFESLRRPLNTERWRHWFSSKRREPITSWRNIIPQKKGILNHTIVNASKPTMTDEEILKGSHFDITWDTELTYYGRNCGKSRNTSIRTAGLLTII